MKLRFKKLNPDAVTPSKGSPMASGFDLYASEMTYLAPGETKLVKTGIAFELEEGYEIQVRPRSGLSLKTPLRIPNAPGTVDADYTGECMVIMHNSGTGTICISKNDRIAQAILCPVLQPELEEITDEIKETKRGTKGFGSSGK